MGVSDLRYEPLRCANGTQWTRLSYRIAGFDEAACELDQAWGLTQAGALVRVTGAVAPWEWPGASARRLAECVVVTGGPTGTDAASGRREADGVAAIVEQAAGDLREFWGEPRARPVVFVPPDAASFTALAGEASQGSSAVTVGPLRDHRALGCDRVVLHPAVWRDLAPEGRRVVLTHELTHLVMRRDLAGARPAWLVEGVCEYAAYRRSPLSADEVARPLLDRLRGTALPVDLPSEEDLAGPDPGWAYAAAWRACEVIVERGGQAALLALARAPAGDGLGRVLSTHLGWGLADLVAAWRQDLARLARPGRS